MDIDIRIKALADHLGCEVDEITEEFDGPMYGEGVAFGCDTEPGEYAVLTEGEADRAWEAALDSYLDECVLPELPDSVRFYFDGEAWKRDARFDGRGHALSSYDGNEHEVKVNGVWLYIYRIN